jgi:hypothetical protein
MSPPRVPTRPTPALVPETDGVPEVDAAKSTSGRITEMTAVATDAIGMAADAARAVRAWPLEDHPTPPDGQPAVDVQVAVAGGVTVKKKPRSRRPSWPATIGMVLASALSGTPIWNMVTGSAAELGELRGRQEALEQQMNSNAAADLKRDRNQAIDFRELDDKIVAIGTNVDAILVQVSVPPERRVTVPATSRETIERHAAAIARWDAAVSAAERRQVEQSIADSDSVAAP